MVEHRDEVRRVFCVKYCDLIKTRIFFTLSDVVGGIIGEGDVDDDAPRALKMPGVYYYIRKYVVQLFCRLLHANLRQNIKYMDIYHYILFHSLNNE